MYTIQVNTSLLTAAQMGAARKDVRHYLNGVLFDIKERLLIGTNGHMIIVAGNNAISPAAIGIDEDGKPTYAPIPADAREFILPNDSLDEMLKAAKARKLVSFQLDIDDSGERASITAHIGSSKYQCSAIDGTFSDWRRPVPRSVSGVAAQYDPAYIMTLSKVARLLGNVYGYVRLHHNGDKAAIVNINANCMAVLMPVRMVDESIDQALSIARLLSDRPMEAAQAA